MQYFQLTPFISSQSENSRTISKYEFAERQLDRTMFSFEENISRKISTSPINKINSCMQSDSLIVNSSSNLYICDSSKLKIKTDINPFRDVVSFCHRSKEDAFSTDSQTQMQLLPLPFEASACCFNADQRLWFAASSQLTGPSSLITICPERWISTFRKLVQIGCLDDARALLGEQEARLGGSRSSDKFKTAKNRCNKAHGLLGFYYFERGDFQRAEVEFSLSDLEIPELLRRYPDLVPADFNYEPDPYFCLAQDKDHNGNNDELMVDPVVRRLSNNGIVTVTDLCLRRSLNLDDIIGDGEVFSTHDNSPDELVDVSQKAGSLDVGYNRFLFDFLLKQRVEKTSEVFSHLIETTLIKLYVKLSRAGQRPKLPQLMESTTEGVGSFASTVLGLGVSNSYSSQLLADSDKDHLIAFVTGLVLLDCDELTGFLTDQSAHHLLGVVYLWQGNVSKALTVWQTLAYGQLVDEMFPGVDFYIAILCSLASTSPPLPLYNDGTNSSTPSIPIYTELVHQHLMHALEEDGKEAIAERLLLTLPPPPSMEAASASSSSRLDGGVVSPSSPSSNDILGQLLTPSQLVNMLLATNHERLARKYSFHVLNTFQVLHDLRFYQLVGEFLIDDVLGSLEDQVEKDRKLLNSKRATLCNYLRTSDSYDAKKLLDRIGPSHSKQLVFETAILLGKLGSHDEALNFLVNEVDNLKAALVYCSDQLICDNKLLHRQAVDNWHAFSGFYLYKDKCKDPVGLPCCFKSDGPGGTRNLLVDDPRLVSAKVFTTLVSICLTRNDEVHNKFALNLLNCSNIPLDYSKIISLLPSHLPLSSLNRFLAKALRQSLELEESMSVIQLGLASHTANSWRLKRQAVEEEVVNQPPPSFIHVDYDTKCAYCRQALSRYGVNDEPYALQLPDQLCHLECLLRSDDIGD